MTIMPPERIVALDSTRDCGTASRRMERALGARLS